MSTGDEQMITTSTKLNGDSLATSRPLFVGRNTVTTPPIYQYDARYTRSLGTYWERVTPKLFIEANNIFNRSNVTEDPDECHGFYVLCSISYNRVPQPGAECKCDRSDYPNR